MNAQGIAGAQQGPSGVSQGFKGAQEGLSNGASTGIQRAADGGMAGSAPGATSSARKPMGLFSFIQPLAGLAASVPGPWQPFAAGASALLNMTSQNKDAAAAGAAQGAEGNALAGASGIAGRLVGPPDYSGIVKAENSGIQDLKNNVGGVANPKAVTETMQGGNIGRAIEGANANQDANLNSAAGILQRNAGAYNQIGAQAGAAAQAQGNPFQLFSDTIAGGGAGGLTGALGGIFGGGGSSSGTVGSNTVGGGGLIGDNSATATYGGATDAVTNAQPNGIGGGLTAPDPYVPPQVNMQPMAPANVGKGWGS